MLTYGQVSGKAHPQPVRITKRKPKAETPNYTVSCIRDGEEHFRNFASADNALAFQAAMMDAGWVSVLSPQPPVLKNGKAAAPSRGIKAHTRAQAATPATPQAGAVEFLDLGHFPEKPAPKAQREVQVCPTCNLTVCDGHDD